MVNATRRADKADLERDQAMKEARDAREFEQKEHQLLLEAQREAREARETEQMEHRLLEESRQQVESAQAALRLKGGIVAPPAVHSAAVATPLRARRRPALFAAVAWKFSGLPSGAAASSYLRAARSSSEKLPR